MNTTDNLKRLFTPQETAAYLAVAPKTIYKWAFYRKIPCIKLGKALRFDKAEIDQWLEKQKSARQAEARFL